MLLCSFIRTIRFTDFSRVDETHDCRRSLRGNQVEVFAHPVLRRAQDRCRAAPRPVPAPVGAANSVIAADLVALCRTRILELGVWLREGLTLRHFQYP